MERNELAEVMAALAAYQAVETYQAVQSHAAAVGLPVSEFCEFMERMSR